MTDDEAPTPEDEEREEEEREEQREEQAEDAEIRHDEGYVETFGNEQTDKRPDELTQQTEEPTSAPRAESIPPAGEVRESEYGAGSAVPGRRGAGPEGWKVKGNADSLLFYTEDSPTYSRSAADVWFETEEAATSAGFDPMGRPSPLSPPHAPDGPAAGPSSSTSAATPST